MNIRISPANRWRTCTGESGRRIPVQLRIRAMERDSVQQIALIALLPGGVDPVIQRRPLPIRRNPMKNEEGNTDANQWRSPVGDYSRSSWYPEFVDVRDDRLVLYGTISRNVETFVFKVRAINAGNSRGRRRTRKPCMNPLCRGAAKAHWKSSSLENACLHKPASEPRRHCGRAGAGHDTGVHAILRLRCWPHGFRAATAGIAASAGQ